MGFRVEADIMDKEGEVTTMFMAQYGGDLVRSGRQAFDKVQKLLAYPQLKGYDCRVVSARYTRTKR